ncbi:MAG: prolyl oligopeptidase family serine peptidase [Opitutaceae bacterium]|nr:prolyl oligopeptidase family serine peptidase [Opitutaceae bacterium]
MPRPTPSSRFRALFAAMALGAAWPAGAAPAAEPPAWRQAMAEVAIPCSDGATQPALWYVPPGPGPKPLLVGLHTWSSQYDTPGQVEDYFAWCAAQGWALLQPNFRGPNNIPPAMGSDRAVADVVEAVAWARRQTDLDDTRLYLLGASGGGHMTLQVVARHPEIWAGASAWCGITDITRWYEELAQSPNPYHYLEYIRGALGGAPTTDERRRAEAWRRSPLSRLAHARGVPLDLNHGLHDAGVPFTHALRAFDAVVPEADRLDPAGLRLALAEVRLPPAWPAAPADPTYGAKRPLFRRTAGSTRVTIFDGGHEMVYQAALNWLSRQRRGRPAVWDLPDFIRLEVAGAASGK